ncbi:MAG: DUF4003 family protein [Clostridium sp.]|uniref:DUF4003 family protein n=1 Tax=Clostridium sp. TaxID=1506 RepID=UPI003F3BB2BA
MGFDRVELMVHNSTEVEMARIGFSDNMKTKITALSLTMRNERVSRKSLEIAVSVIKKNISMFSSLRRNVGMLASVLAFEEDMEGALKDIVEIYNKLKKVFFGSEYLVLAAITIFRATDSLSSDVVIEKARRCYELMKKDHPFLTGSDDISVATILALTSDNIEGTMKEVELYYVGLNNIGFWKGNNLQALANVMPMFEIDPYEGIGKIKRVEKLLAENKIPVRGECLPILGVIAGVTKDEVSFVKTVRLVSDNLSEIKGFGNLLLGKDLRNMIAIGLTLLNEIDELDNENRLKFTNITENIALNIEIAIEMAIMAASTAAIIAANSNS